MFFFGGGKCPNLGVVNVRILGVVNVLLANDSQSLHSLVIGSEGVEVTVMEKETSCALWYSTLCRHIAFVFTFLLQSLAWSSPLV